MKRGHRSSSKNKDPKMSQDTSEGQIDDQDRAAMIISLMRSLSKIRDEQAKKAVVDSIVGLVNGHEDVAFVEHGLVFHCGGSFTREAPIDVFLAEIPHEKGVFSAFLTSTKLRDNAGKIIASLKRTRASLELEIQSVVSFLKQAPKNASSSRRKKQDNPITANEKASQPQFFSLCKKGPYKSVLKALESGQGKDVPDFQGFYPIHIAASYGNLEAVKALLDHGADVNSMAAKCSTPLHEAVAHNHLETVVELLERGADRSVRVEWHGKETCTWTPLELAVEMGRWEAVALLMRPLSEEPEGLSGIVPKAVFHRAPQRTIAAFLQNGYHQNCAKEIETLLVPKKRRKRRNGSRKNGEKREGIVQTAAVAD